MAVEWTYSDWILLDDGAAKLTRLRLHIKEVSDSLVSGSFTERSGGMRVDKAEIESYLAALRTDEKELAKRIGGVAGTGKTSWTRGVAIRE